MSYSQASSQELSGSVDRAVLFSARELLDPEKLSAQSVRRSYYVKRVMDLTAASIGLLLLAPLFALIAVMIRLESRGGIFFRQERIGHAGKVFRIWKFRTMCTDAEAKLPELESSNESPGCVLFKLRRDPRVTRIGQVLRRTSLDELPQLINVLMGEMSLVGPRPLPIRDCIRLEAIDEAGYRQRHQVLPGITCLWQVSGRSQLGADQMIDLDCHYIQNWSLWRDMKILFRTMAVVVVDRNGSY
jgi:lipopolysaccharide/colanic/teichoic acid biosynthesis glycosyltransferase